MQKKHIEIEYDKQTNPWKWVALILIGLMLLDLSCFTGALIGGVAGYGLGRKTAQSSGIMRDDFDFPLMPGMPEMPEHPRIPLDPLSPGDPRFDMPWIPELGGQPRLGVTFIMTDEGAEIIGIVPESPAEQSGIRIGDVITKVDGYAVKEGQPLDEHIMRYQPGDIVSLTVLRDGRTFKIEVELAGVPQG